MNFQNKKVLICGLALSGISSARLLKLYGAEIIIQDIKQRDKFKELPDILEKEDIKLLLGENPDSIVQDMDLIVLSPGIPTDLPFIEKARSFGIPVWGEVELAFTQCKCPVIAITGTNGKSTTTTLVGEILKEVNSEAEVVGNIGIPFTERVPMLPESGWAVAEISSFQLETIHTFRPKISAVLNITPDHLNRHKTLENYTSIKEKIFKNQNDSDFLILNYDDKACRDMKNRAKCQTIFYSCLEKTHNGVYLDGDSIRANINGFDRFIMKTENLDMIVGNALAAVAISLCADVPDEVIRKTITGFKALEHRIEYVTEIKGVKYYNDSKATNPDSAIKGLEAMTRPVVLICGGYDKDSDFSEWVKTFGSKVKIAIVMGQVKEKMINTMKAYGFNNYEIVNSLKDAVSLSQSRASQGDCVLLSPACASWDMFDNYEQRGNLFKEFVQQEQAGE